MSPELSEAKNRPAAPLPSELPPLAIPPNPRAQATLEDLLAQASSIGQRLAELQAELAAGKQAADEEAKEDEEAREGERQNDRASTMPVTSLEPTAHVARRLRVSVRTVERWIKAGTRRCRSTAATIIALVSCPRMTISAAKRDRRRGVNREPPKRRGPRTGGDRWRGPKESRQWQRPFF